MFFLFLAVIHKPDWPIFRRPCLVVFADPAHGSSKSGDTLPEANSSSPMKIPWVAVDEVSFGAWAYIQGLFVGSVYFLAWGNGNGSFLFGWLRNMILRRRKKLVNLAWFLLQTLQRLICTAEGGHFCT